MNIKHIKTFTYRCVNCDTSIRFPIPPVNKPEEIDELFGCINTLECPKCKIPLNEGASKVLTAIKKYNAVALELNCYMENNVELDLID